MLFVSIEFHIMQLFHIPTNAMHACTIKYSFQSWNFVKSHTTINLATQCNLTVPTKQCKSGNTRVNDPRLVRNVILSMLIFLFRVHNCVEELRISLNYKFFNACFIFKFLPNTFPIISFLKMPTILLLCRKSTI